MSKFFGKIRDASTDQNHLSLKKKLRVYVFFFNQGTPSPFPKGLRTHVNYFHNFRHNYCGDRFWEISIKNLKIPAMEKGAQVWNLQAEFFLWIISQLFELSRLGKWRKSMKIMKIIILKIICQLFETSRLQTQRETQNLDLMIIE